MDACVVFVYCNLYLGLLCVRCSQRCSWTRPSACGLVHLVSSAPVFLAVRSGRQHLKDDETLESENGLEVRTAKSGLLCFFGRSFPCVFEWGVREGKNGRSGGS